MKKRHAPVPEVKRDKRQKQCRGQSPPAPRPRADVLACSNAAARPAFRETRQQAYSEGRPAECRHENVFVEPKSRKVQESNGARLNETQRGNARIAGNGIHRMIEPVLSGTGMRIVPKRENGQYVRFTRWL